MIFGVGTDLVAVERVARVLRRHPDRFADRILAVEERAGYAASPDPAGFLAKRFAAKEAAAKALGTGIGGDVGWHDLSVAHDVRGRPLLKIAPAAAVRVSPDRPLRPHLSLSDEAGQALAFVIIELAGGTPSQA